MREDTARLFVAVPLPAQWHDALTEAQEQLRAAGLRLRYTRPEGIHLTLVFLGEVATGRIPGMITALAAVQAPPPELTLGDAGTFGSARRPRVIWVGIGGDLAALGRLQKSVAAALAPLGFAGENRGFRPHLTLARVPERMGPAEAAIIVPAVTRLRLRPPQPHLATSFDLMQSHLGQGGATYTRVHRWDIAGSAGPAR